MEEDFPRRTRRSAATSAASTDKKGVLKRKPKEAQEDRLLFQEDAPRRTSKRKTKESSTDGDEHKTKKQKKKRKSKQKNDEDEDNNDDDDDNDADDLNLKYLDGSDDEDEPAKPKRKMKEKFKKKEQKKGKQTKKTKSGKKDLEDDDSDDDDSEDAEDEDGEEEGKGKKRKVKPLKGSLDEDVEAFDGGVRRKLYMPLSQKTLSSDMLLLAVVKEVRDYEIVLSLPGGASGFLPITSISDIYTRQLEKLSKEEDDENEEEEESIPKPSGIFTVGCLVACKVKSAESTPTGRPRIQVSVNPREVNGNLAPVMLRKGMVLSGCVSSKEDHGYMIDVGLNKVQVLSGCVSSKEDHGYMIDVGLNKVQAFLGWKDARQFVTERNLSKPLYIGQPIQCLITKVQANGRSLIVTADPSVVAEAIADKESHNSLQTLLPGTKVTATVAKVNKDHLIVTVLDNYSGHIAQIHLEDHAFPTDHYKPKQQITGTIVCNNQSLKTVALSLSPHHLSNHFEFKVRDPFAGLRQGHILEQGRVLRVDSKSGLLVKVNQNLRGMVHPSRLPDSNADKVKDNYKSGQQVKCRIVDFNLFDGLAVLSMKKSILEQPFMGYHDIKPGIAIEGKVYSFSDKGVKVQVADRTFGFVPNSHLADIPISKPKEKYKVGDKMQLRVLNVDASRRRLVLTHKRTLVESSLPVITAYDQVEGDMMLHGYIVAVKAFGCIVSFYNDVKGLIPTAELSSDPTLIPAQAFHFGQVVKCRVIQTHHPSLQKITLSLRRTGSTHQASKVVASNLQLGQIESVQVTKVASDGLEVSVTSDDTKGFIPTMHLSDHHDNCRALLASYKKGSVIAEAMYWGNSAQKSCPIFTCKRSILKMADTKLTSSLESLESGMMMMGHVKRIMPYGVFVEGNSNLVGLAPKGALSDSFIPNTDNCFEIGQTVRAQVTQVDKEKNRFLVSLKSSQCPPEKDEGLQLLEEYLSERDELCKKLKGEYKHIVKLSAGDVVNGTLSEEQDVGLICTLPNGITGIMTKEHADDGSRFCHYSDDMQDVGLICTLPNGITGIMTKEHADDDEDFEEGGKVKACVLHSNLLDNTVYLSVKPELLQIDAKKKRKTPKKKGDKGKKEATVEFVHDHFVLAFVADEGFVYLPGRKHLNEIQMDKHTVGQTLTITMKRVVNGRQLAEAVREKTKKSGKDASEETMKEKLSKAEKIGQIPALQVGQVVTATVKSVKELQLYVTTEKGIYGRVHVTEIADNLTPGSCPLESFKVGDEIKAKVIGHREIKEHKYLPITHRGFKRMGLELSIKPSVLDSDDKIEEMTMEQQLSSFKNGQAVPIVVQKYHKSILWVALKPGITGKVYQLNVSKRLGIVNDPAPYFKPGSVHQGHVLKVDMEQQLVELTLAGNTELQLSEGAVVNGRITNVSPDFGLSIQLPYGLHGNVHITDVHDKFRDNPLKGLAKNHCVRCCVLSCDNKDKIVLSMKPSLLGHKCDKKKDQQVEIFSDVKKGQLLKGYIKQTSDKGIFISLSRAVVGRVEIRRISSKFYVNKLQASFPPGKLMVAKVISVDAKKKRIELSCCHGDTGLADQVPETFRGKPRLDANDEQMINIDDKTSETRRDKTSETRRDKTSETRSDKTSETRSDSGTDDEEVERTEKDNKKSKRRTDSITAEDKDKIQTKKRKMMTFDDGDDKPSKKMGKKGGRRHRRNSRGSDSGVGEAETLSDTEVEVISREPSRDASQEPRLAVAAGFSWDDNVTMATKTSKSSMMRQDEESSSSEDESDEEEEKEEVKEKPVKKSKKEKEAERKAEEDFLYKTEHALMDNERTPETGDDFDRLVLSSPDSSLVWIRYMAYHLHSAEVEKARTVAERALKEISFREEQEKLNVWVAYMNLENMYGTEESLMKVFQRALKFNEPIKVFQQLVTIYVRTEKMEAAEQLYNTMVKRFNFNKEVWVSYGMFLMKNGKQEAARKLMQRSFKSLHQKEHVDVIVKFSQLEFKFGETERGKTMFENVLSNYPKRTDIWSVYLDMMIKDGDTEATRHVFERVIHLTLSAKKMKFFFKRYLDFEKKFGSESTINSVKQKAVEYVESKAAVGTPEES